MWAAAQLGRGGRRKSSTGYLSSPSLVNAHSTAAEEGGGSKGNMGQPGDADGLRYGITDRDPAMV